MISYMSTWDSKSTEYMKGSEKVDKKGSNPIRSPGVKKTVLNIKV